MKTKTKYPVSFTKVWDKQGYVYNQQIKMDKSTFLNIERLVQIEINNGKPNKEKYISTSGYECYLKPLEMEGSYCFLNHSQQRYINLYLNLPLKDRNTRILVKGEKPEVQTHYQYKIFN